MLRPDSRAWFPIFTALSTGTAAFAISWIGEANPIAITFFASILSAVLFVIFDYIVDLSLNSYTLRQKFDYERSQFEGEYLEFYLTERSAVEGKPAGVDVTYAYFRIRHTGKKGDPYLLKGNAYHADGRNVAKWESSMMRFNGECGILDYFYFGYFFEKQHSVRGIGNLNFNDETSYSVLPLEKESKIQKRLRHKTRYNSGTGFFVDSSASGISKNKFHFIRVDNRIIEKVLGVGIVCNLDAERLFVKKFHEKFGSRIAENSYLLFNCEEGNDF